MTFSKVLAIPKGTKIGPYIVKGRGTSRAAPALVYLIRNRKGGRPNEKRIGQSEWNAAVRYLDRHGTFPLSAFRKKMPDAAKDGPCNYRFVCELFTFLGLTTGKQGRVNTQGNAASLIFRLTPELVPTPLQGRSAYRMLGSRAVWKKQIRPEALERTNHCCVVCGSSGERLICHDKWRYDDQNATATLIGFEIHCADCDAVTHSGNAFRIDPTPETVRALLSRLCAVNECSLEMAADLLEAALIKWEERNGKSWTLKVDSALVEKYPELAALPDFVPPPIGL